MAKLIAEFIVRSALIAFCTAIGLFLLRVKAARVRHRVWASVVVLMLALPAWTVWGPKAVLHVLTPPVTMPMQTVMAESNLSATAVPSPAVPQPIWTWQNSLLALYLVGAGFLLVRLLTGTVRAQLLVQRAGNQAGRLTSDECVTPLTVGWVRPSIILPAGWVRWSAAQLRAVLAHEQEHVRRRDPLVQWLALLNRAVFWFHPLAWWIEKHLSGLAEEACDDAVLMRGQDPLEYSEYLLGLARVVQQSGSRVSVVGMSMPGTFLPERIRRIAGGAKMQRISRERMVSLIVVCAVVSTIFTAGAIGYSPAAPQTAPPEPVQALVASAPVARAATPLTEHKKTILLAQAAPPVTPTTRQSISGTVFDPANLAITGAWVTLKSVDTGAELRATTNNLGAYRFENFSPGIYSITVSVPGFKISTQTAIPITAGEALSAGKMSLVVGSVVESVTVMGSRTTPVTTPAATRTLGETPGILTCVDCPARPASMGGNIVPVMHVSAPRPVYPAEQQRQGVAGTVKLQAVITKDGLVNELTASGSPDPGLTRAAMEAVWQWRYRPALLNGQPIEVLSAIDVNFVLAN